MSMQPEMTSAIFKMVISLGAVLCLIFLLLYLVRKFSGQKQVYAGGQAIQVMENRYIGVKKTISLVKVPGSYLVIGVAGDRISLLDKIDHALVDDVLKDDPPDVKADGFSAHLKKLTENIIHKKAKGSK